MKPAEPVFFPGAHLDNAITGLLDDSSTAASKKSSAALETAIVKFLEENLEFYEFVAVIFATFWWFDLINVAEILYDFTTIITRIKILNPS